MLDFDTIVSSLSMPFPYLHCRHIRLSTIQSSLLCRRITAILCSAALGQSQPPRATWELWKASMHASSCGTRGQLGLPWRCGKQAASPGFPVVHYFWSIWWRNVLYFRDDHQTYCQWDRLVMACERTFDELCIQLLLFAFGCHRNRIEHDAVHVIRK